MEINRNNNSERQVLTWFTQTWATSTKQRVQYYLVNQTDYNQQSLQLNTATNATIQYQ